MAVEEDDVLDSVGEITEDDLNIKSNDFREMVVAPTDWTISVLVDLLKRKKIDLQPNYQRRIAWTVDKMSKFIESLFLRLPVPQIVLAETSPGRFAVIDGKQRLNSLARFCLDIDSPLTLKGCEYRQDLDGLTYAKMQSRDDLEGSVDAFQSHTVRTTVVKNWGSDELLYLLFLRLNQNSVTLSPQELRRALYPGAFLNWLDEKTSTSPGMQQIFARIPDFRMRDMELATRFLGFHLYGSLYAGNMKQFLDNVTEHITAHWKNLAPQIEDAWTKYEESISTTVAIFGPDAFKMWQRDRFLPTKNRAVMDVMTYYFSAGDTSHTARQNSAAVKDAFKSLCDHDDDFRRSLQVSTKTDEATNMRFTQWGQTLQAVLNTGVRDYPSTLLQY
ncbi:DUF262 domain-containing protein [Candidatus Phyllobacterium onerii]|uniref:DUF262 domain-containing protein n=1 Tax=Candidatus Phyllobacterium onerii TaxID=3020828 RepID=UPI00232CDB21|nr:DUF262 domain-containing protein [Phyllobacterium sp. IY22]